MTDHIAVHSYGCYQAPPGASLDNVEERLVLLEELDRWLREKKHIPRRDDAVYLAEILPGIALYSALYEADQSISSDTRTLLATILDRTRELREDEATAVMAKVGLWPTIGDYVATDRDWVEFRRRRYPTAGITSKSFCEHVDELFPNLVLSSEFPNCLDTLDGGFAAVLPIVITALSALNDDLVPNLRGSEIVDGLKKYTAACGFETTMEGDASRNATLTFGFEKAGRLVCAPHMKLHTSGVPGDSKHYHNRIYFNPRQTSDTTTVHVGHVGKHL